MEATAEMTDEEYLAVKRELTSTSRGRAFAELLEERSRAMAKQEVAMLVDELRQLLKRNATHAHRQAELLRVLRREFEEISRYIQQTRQEIAALQPEDESRSWIKTATGELDAIVTATEQATYDILGAAEEVQRLVHSLPAESDIGTIRQSLENQVTSILTACSFQDITGQRTTKVVNAIRFLEERVNSMVAIWGTDKSSLRPTASAIVDARPDAHLLNGPALGGGISQEQADALIANGSAASAKPAAKAAVSSSQAEIDALFE
jgi:chemotaxis regulatin CheY-phosphate phosphatase CheZ